MAGFTSGKCAYDVNVPSYIDECSIGLSSAEDIGLGDGNCAVDVNECESNP